MKIKKTILVALVATLSIFGISSACLSQPTLAYVCTGGTIRDGDSVEFPSECNTPKTDKEVEPVLITVINFLVGLCGLIAIFVVVICGLQMALSQGDSAKVAKARKGIIFGIVGLIISLLAFAIVNLVLKNVLK